MSNLPSISTKRRSLLRGIASASAATTGLSAPFAIAQSAYPNKPVKVIIPFPPGGSTDIVGRLIAQRLTAALGQSFVPDNRGGAGGTIGAMETARANPDGYTIGIGTVSTLGTAQAAYPNLKYDPRKDFAPIVNIAAVPGIIAVHPSFPAQNHAEFLKVIKANPGKYNYASSGSGAIGHMAMELYKFQTGAFMTHIAYRGAGPALTDVLAGTVPIFWDNLSSTLPHVKSGKLRAIGLAYDKRIPQLPDLPTFAELGLPKYEAATWFGLVGPAALPKDIIAKLNAEVVKILASDEVKARFLDVGAFPIGNTPDQYKAQIEKELVKWAAVGKFAKVVAD